MIVLKTVASGMRASLPARVTGTVARKLSGAMHPSNEATRGGVEAGVFYAAAVHEPAARMAVAKIGGKTRRCDGAKEEGSLMTAVG